MKKRDLYDKVNYSRNDLSKYLWHFCREDSDPIKTIRSILEDGVIRPSYNSDSGTKTVCFTEMPLEEVKRQLPVLRESNYEHFSSYGIGFKKSIVFENGGLPVIYGPKEDVAKLGESFAWRHVGLFFKSGIPEFDYTWQREWRVNGSFDFSNLQGEVIVVVPDVDGLEELLYEVEDDGDYIDGEAVSTPFVYPVWALIELNSIKDEINDSVIEGLCRHDDLCLD